MLTINQFEGLMLEVARNGVHILDAVVEAYTASPKELTFIQWWSSMTEAEKSAIVFRILLHRYGEGFRQTTEVPDGTTR
jgi:hypothetical protein